VTIRHTIPPSRQRVAETLGAVTERPHDPAQQRRSLDVCRNYWIALDNRDAAALRRLMADDVLVEFPFSESGTVQEFRVLRGLEDVMSFWEGGAWKAEAEGGSLVDAEVAVSADGQIVFIEGFGDATMTNGQPYYNRYVIRMMVDGGLVTSFRMYYNPIISARAFGRPVVGSPDPVTP
jgi:ketosteroid isomerase-like protein